MRMRGRLRWLLVSVGAAASCVHQPELRGPLATRNQHPAQLLVGHLGPTSTRVLPAGDVSVRGDAAYTSLFLFGADAGGSWFMDGEVLRASAAASYGVGGGVEVGVAVPVAHAGGGFLDSFLIDYHDWFGLPDQDRSALPRDAFRVDASRPGESVWSMEPHGLELMDIPVSLSWQVAPPGERAVGIKLRGAVDLPAGDAGRGYGNGELDVALGAVAEYWRDGIGYTVHAQHAFAGSPATSRRRGFTFEDVSAAGVALELPVHEDWNVLVQVEWESSTLRNLGPRVAANDQALLWVGGRWTPDPSWSLEFSFGEDLLEQASPDFTAWLGMEWRLGWGAQGRATRSL